MRLHIVRRILPIAALAALLAAPAARAQGGGLQLTVTIGIGGRYRPGGWIPVTVGVLNPGPAPVHGQVQVSAEDADGGPTGDAVFACPADVGPSPVPQFFQVYAQGMNPTSENISVQVVDGEERGDGATLAQTSSLGATRRNAFNGVPVAPRDLLLVGLSADSTAITRLSGQNWGLRHTADGPAPTVTPPQMSARLYGYQPYAASGPGLPALAQAVVGSPVDLPDRPAGYAGVDAVLLRADAPLDALTEAQTDALKGWVADGGHLVVCGGADAAPYTNAFYAGLLPAEIGPVTGTRLSLTPKPLPGVRILVFSRGRPAVVTGPYGAGQVTLLASDPTQAALGGRGAASLWRTVLTAAPSSLLGAVTGRAQESDFFSNGGTAQLSDTVMRAPSLDAPGAGVIGLFLIGYVLVLVPLNYLILKRLDKKEWSWATIPALVLVFAAATYGVGYAAKGSRVFVNRAAILETTSGRREAGVCAAFGLFSPHRTSYDLTVADPDALAALPAPPGPRFMGMYGRRPDDPAATGQARFVEGGEGVRLVGAAVNMWAMRAFDVQTTTDLGGAVTARLAQNPQSGAVGGTVVNRTAYGLTDCRLYLNGSWRSLANLPAGTSLPVSAFFPPPSPPAAGSPPSGNAGQMGWSQMPPPQADGDSSEPTVRARMRTALSAFVCGLGGPEYDGQYYSGGGDGPPSVFQPRPGEAILTGWCSDPSLAGPPVRVDGHPVQQNAVTLVVIHLPLP